MLLIRIGMRLIIMSGINNKEDWPTQEVWVWLYMNEHIPPWITLQRLKEEWRNYIKRGAMTNENEMD